MKHLIAMNLSIVIFFIFLLTSISCDHPANKNTTSNINPVATQIKLKRSAAKVVHVYVALCDNKYQGIVPVPAGIGNGQNAATNLYWGAACGVKSFLKKQPHWKLVQTQTTQLPEVILERCVFKHTQKEVYLVADAYDGKRIKNCTIDFLRSCSGVLADSVTVNNKVVYCGGSANIIAYTGHDGLMDFNLPEQFYPIDSLKREAIILACISKKYFSSHLKATGAAPLLWTTGLCSPEAYSLDAALQSWINGQSTATIQLQAAKAYDRYQHCGLKAASRLLVSGW